MYLDPLISREQRMSLVHERDGVRSEHVASVLLPENVCPVGREARDEQVL